MQSDVQGTLAQVTATILVAVIVEARYLRTNHLFSPNDARNAILLSFPGIIVPLAYIWEDDPDRGQLILIYGSAGFSLAGLLYVSLASYILLIRARLSALPLWLVWTWVLLGALMPWSITAVAYRQVAGLIGLLVVGSVGWLTGRFLRERNLAFPDAEPSLDPIHTANQSFRQFRQPTQRPKARRRWFHRRRGPQKPNLDRLQA